MSNPYITTGNVIPIPADPSVVRDIFWRVVYSQENFYTYPVDEFDPAYTTFVPTGKGDRFYMFVALDNALGAGPPPGTPPGTMPSFVSLQAWNPALLSTSSGFVTARNSIMPRIIIPSFILTDNGILYPGKNCEALITEGGVRKNLFNWFIESVTLGVPYPFPPVGFNQVVNYGPYVGSQYITLKYKDDAKNTNSVTVSLRQTDIDLGNGPPLGSAHDWLLEDSSNLIVGGAFTLMINMTLSKAGAIATADDAAEAPYVSVAFGDVTMIISPSGNTVVTVEDAAGNKNVQTVNLAVGKSATGPPQQQHMNDKDPFIITIYPCWNGIIVSSGVQDSRASVMSSSYYIPKIKEASIMKSPYSSGFDPLVPANVKVGVGTPGDPDYVMVDFGAQLVLTAVNCQADIAYLPCFFSRECWFDEWFMESDDTSDITYTYAVYAIWTDNGVATIDLTPPPAPTITTFVGTLPNTKFAHINWRVHSSNGIGQGFDRIGGEIFGSILHTKEANNLPIRNDNGNFTLTWTGGTCGDSPAPSSADWYKYIQSVQVSTNLDGSSGSISVDKYGLAGQGAVADQSIGALTLDASGGENTVAGPIWQGLGMGVSDSKDSDGATWTIPLKGLELKLDDIKLINVPFFDGYLLGDVLKFLCHYAGLVEDLTNADPTVRLGISADVNVPRFDWKSGTTVKQALEDVMDDVIHDYVVRDGKIFFYKVDPDTGLPFACSTTFDWESLYPDTKIMVYDASPDFDDLYNEIVVLGLQQVSDGQGTDITQMPMYPRYAVRQNVTTPSVPWAKTMSRNLTGYLNDTILGQFADRLAAASSTYLLMGTTQLPGNASIRPYDRWGDFVISGVTQNLNFENKVWTTTLEFMRQTLP